MVASRSALRRESAPWHSKRGLRACLNQNRTVPENRTEGQELGLMESLRKEEA